MEDRILVGDHVKVLRADLGEHLGGLGPEFRMELEVAHTAVPALRIAVGRQKDEPITGDALLAQRAGQPQQLGRIGEVARRLEIAQRPAWWQRRAAQ